MGVIVSYIFAAIFIVLVIVILIWFLKNKPDGEVDTPAEFFNTPEVLMTAKGRMIVVLVGLSFLAAGGLLVWLAIS